MGSKIPQKGCVESNSPARSVLFFFGSRHGVEGGEACFAPSSPNQHAPCIQRALSQFLTPESFVAVLIPRVRTIGVRLSEEEYSALENFCVSSGARSISDLARSAICRFVNHAYPENDLVSAINTHDAQVKGLERKLEELTAEIVLLKAQKAAEQESTRQDQDSERNLQPEQNSRARSVSEP